MTEPETTLTTTGFWKGRSTLVMPGLLGVLSLVLLVGGARLGSRAEEFPGPGFVPMIIGGIGLVLTVLLTIEALRTPESLPEATGQRYRTHSDFAALAWVAGGFLVFALLLDFLGWILAGALVFWCTARGFGSRSPLFDILVALFLSSLVYLIFHTGLDLVLPSGLLGGGF